MRVLSSPCQAGISGGGSRRRWAFGGFLRRPTCIGLRDHLTIKQHYSWTAEADGATKTSSFITVDAECASPIVTVDYERWKKAHANEVAIMAPFPPMGAPWLNPRGPWGDRSRAKQRLERPWIVWTGRGGAQPKPQQLPTLRADLCAPGLDRNSGPTSGRWINQRTPAPVIGFGLLGIGAVGMSGLLEACILWLARGEFRRPRD